MCLSAVTSGESQFQIRQLMDDIDFGGTRQTSMYYEILFHRIWILRDPLFLIKFPGRVMEIVKYDEIAMLFRAIKCALVATNIEVR